MEKCESRNESEGLFMENVKSFTCIRCVMGTHYIFALLDASNKEICQG